MRLQNLLNTDPDAISQRFEYPAMAPDLRENSPDNAQRVYPQSLPPKACHQAQFHPRHRPPQMMSRPQPTSPLSYPETAEPPVKRRRTGEQDGNHHQPHKVSVFPIPEPTGTKPNPLLPLNQTPPAWLVSPAPPAPTVAIAQTNFTPFPPYPPKPILLPASDMTSFPICPAPIRLAPVSAPVEQMHTPGPVNVPPSLNNNAGSFLRLLTNEEPSYWQGRAHKFVAQWQAFYAQCSHRAFGRMTSDERGTMILALRTFSSIRALGKTQGPNRRRQVDESLLNACVNSSEFMQGLIDAYDECLANSKATGQSGPYIGVISTIRMLNRELPRRSDTQRMTLLASLGLSQPEAT